VQLNNTLTYFAQGFVSFRNIAIENGQLLEKIRGPEHIAKNSNPWKSKTVLRNIYPYNNSNMLFWFKDYVLVVVPHLK
jgi:hypothetical protein